MRRRFFVEQFENQRAVMKGDAAHHLGRVLRAEPGQLYELSDGKSLWLGRVETVGRDRLEFALIEELPVPAERLEILLLLSIVKFEAFEWALEKATELGVNRIVPLAAARSEKALIGAAVKRAERWRKILLESSQQCRRVAVPVLEPVMKPAAAFGKYNGGVRIVFSEAAGVPSLRAVLSGVQTENVVMAIGPEGGWTEEEFAAGRAAVFREASLGKLILRTETAVVAGLAAIRFALNE
jgi:16S rRNA (uracil1498-N3)-methyltransferase